MNHECFFTIIDNEVKLCFPTATGWTFHGFPAKEAREFAGKILAMADALERGQTGTNEPILVVNAADLETPLAALTIEDPQELGVSPEGVARMRSMFCPRGRGFLARFPETLESPGSVSITR